MSKNEDLVVIGAGPGGYTAAFLAADRGLNVTIVDELARPGGVCLHHGCMPSKALLHLAKVLTDARESGPCGIEFDEPSIDLSRLRQWKNDVVAKLTGGLGQLAKQRKVSYVQGRAVFEDAHTLTVNCLTSGQPQRLSFDHAVVATGSRPLKPTELELDDGRILDSTGALELEKIPDSMLVIGGGYIGLELGTVYAALGCNVTIVEMSNSLLPGADSDLVRVVSKRISSLVEDVCLETTVTNLSANVDGIDATLQSSDGSFLRQRFERVLVAVGRIPNSNLAGLEKTRVANDNRGFLLTDAQCRTAEPSIFAIGDVAGEPMLAHKAFHEARVAVEAICGGSSSFQPLAIPAVVFTDPEVAWCGLTETRAAELRQPVAIAKFPWGASGRALTLNRPEGLTKLVLDRETQQLLGVGIVGVGAGELIAEGVAAVEMGMTVSDLSSAIHPHPTLSETLGEAADVFLGQSAHVYRPRKS